MPSFPGRMRLPVSFRRVATLPLALLLAAGCGSAPETPRASETFHWVDQPIAFAPPPARWRREGDNSGGTLGVRFVLEGGGGQCITVCAYSSLAQRDRRADVQRFITRRDSLSRGEFMHELSLLRSNNDDPINEREAEAVSRMNDAIGRATSDYLGQQPAALAADLDDALRAASSFQPTMEDLLPRLRLEPSRMQEPERWRLGEERDTTIAGRPVFASFDTLITPERPLLYREIFWVVNGRAFKAVYQGTLKNLPAYSRLVDSIQFPGDAVAATP